MIIIEHKDQSVEVLLADGTKKFFYPNFDLELSKSLQGKFNQYILSSDLNESWKYKEFYIFPAIQETLYWQFFVYLVAHKEVIEFIFSSSENINFNRHSYYTVSGVERVYNYLSKHKKHKFFKSSINNVLLYVLQKVSTHKELLFVDDGFGNFRYKDLKNKVSEYCLFSRVDRPINSFKMKISQILNTLWIGKRLILNKTSINKSYKMPFLDEYLSDTLKNDLIKSLDCYIQNIITESNNTTKYLENKKIKKIISYDNIEGNISLVIASKLNNIEYISYQHASYSRFSSGWIGFDIDSKYNNVVPDKLVVWGSYWKDILIKYSNKYNELNILVGCFRNGNKKVNFISNKYQVNKTKSLTVLYPYEFLTNTLSVSKYLQLMIEAGWKVVVKVRPKGSGDLDSDLYSFPKGIRDKINFVDNLSDSEIINNIDLVVGNQTTYILEMIPFNKPIWILDTDFKMLIDFVELGIVPFVDVDILESIISDEGTLKDYLKPKYSQDFFKELFSENDFNTVVKGLLK